VTFNIANLSKGKKNDVIIRKVLVVKVLQKNVKTVVSIFIHLDRDLRCDFDSPFWEQQDCSWRYNLAAMASTGLSTATGLNAFSRVKITTPDYNYWLRQNPKTGS